MHAGCMSLPNAKDSHMPLKARMANLPKGSQSQKTMKSAWRTKKPGLPDEDGHIHETTVKKLSDVHATFGEVQKKKFR